jgi:glycerophosphoryl diester phosphodiesterase
MTLDQPWPYPQWIAHRGAGLSAPENTLEAIQMGLAMGYRMFECDVKLSKDGVPYLMHDDLLLRTTGQPHAANALTWLELQRLDAGNWHSTAFADTRIPSLAQVMDFCTRSQSEVMVNFEIKPNPGESARTGKAVARAVRAHWKTQAERHSQEQPPQALSLKTLPLLSSFDLEALSAAKASAPELPRALLLAHADPNWLVNAQNLGCCAIVGHFSMWNKSRVQEVLEADLACVSYTVNDPEVARQLLDWGINSLITDRMDAFSRNSAHPPLNGGSR